MNTAITSTATDFDAALRRTLHCSRYVQRLLDSDSELLPWLRINYAQPCNAAEMQAWLDAMPVTDDDSLSRALRRLRKLVMLKLLARDLGGLADLDEVMAGMTALAELAVQHAQASVMQSLVAQYGQPTGAASGAPQEMLVVGMGKLGGRELNVSSDIDLIFLYPEDGETKGARSISNHEFFSKLGRRLISLIGELTGEGYVFRVDMRLRPYGDSGPLAMSFAALEEYLVEQGREWERYAWIKARVISPAGCPAANEHGKTASENETRHVPFPHPNPPPEGEGANESLRESCINELMQLAQPFVFRKYLDFGAFESMRKLHAQIRQEVQRRDRLNNIKLGPGGIREIEFIAQVFQLIRGGRDASLRIRPTLHVLQLLREHGQLEPETVAGLSEAYIFLRNLEHRLQYLDDQQTQDLPENPGDQALVATGMGYPDYGAMLEQLAGHRTLVSEQFAKIFSTQESDTPESTLWRENMQMEEVRDGLGELGYADATNLAERLLRIRDSARYRQLPETSRQRMDKLIPQFIALCAVQDNRDQALPRVLNLLESISRRASYLAFLAEYPQVLQPLVGIASASEWACGYLIQHPILLDELLDAREIYHAPDWAALDAALRQQLAECGADTERQMDVLRQFQYSQTFRLLAMDLQNLLPLEKLSDHLSDLADLILRHVLQLCWNDARKKHREQAQFAVISYGKLGGRELGYASDLDLIFLYDDPHPDAAEIYARLAKRINTLLSSHTSSGRLYEIDLRLRPNGASGLLVSSIAAFEEYQQQHAWVWEHQALTRARFSAGDAQVGEQFEAIRNAVLRKPRDLEALRREIVAMRQKMRDEHANKGSLFDIKHDRGGMVDIEFMVQFLVLAHAHAHPELTANSGNLALLKSAGALGLIDAQMAAAVCAIYRRLRALQHKMRLNNQSPCRVDADEIDPAPVLALWEELLKKDQAA
ncbi:MAG: bifunctional [glutamate--ammonia ligase]-adenylyl-L-tyrosine phosphorylase/[glutamate--ammonia-ligase] adenylyltransferase [Gallionellaceae bacterium]|nr:bifunctional [glutamate--ammonia ligase]-adenylyl-L-tyrosine phosphorylase/[glutamate--ammonia-ligase] adenylyltransferase [Gallionellaceae bacterium]